MSTSWCKCLDCEKEFYPRIDGDKTTYQCPYCGSQNTAILKLETPEYEIKENINTRTS